MLSSKELHVRHFEFSTEIWFKMVINSTTASWNGSTISLYARSYIFTCVLHVFSIFHENHTLLLLGSTLTRTRWMVPIITWFNLWGVVSMSLMLLLWTIHMLFNRRNSVFFILTRWLFMLPAGHVDVLYIKSSNFWFNN